MDLLTAALALLVSCTAALAQQAPGPAAQRRVTLDAPAGTFHIRDGRDFAAAFVDGGATQLIILNSITLSDEVGTHFFVTTACLVPCQGQPPRVQQTTPQLGNTLRRDTHMSHHVSARVRAAGARVANCLPPIHASALRTGAPTPSQSVSTATSPLPGHLPTPATGRSWTSGPCRARYASVRASVSMPCLFTRERRRLCCTFTLKLREELCTVTNGLRIRRRPCRVW